MADNQTYQALVQIMGKGGCPACAATQQSVERYIKGLFDESILDPDVRAHLRASLGLCHDHAWLAQEAGLSDALGLAIVYNELIGALQKEELVTSRGCPACNYERETEERILAVLIKAVRRDDFLQLLADSEGLCLAHLNSLLAIDTSATSRGALLNLHKAIWGKLLGELSEFIRKNDYRYSSEPIGRESNSYKRAIAVLVGRNRRRRKWDE